MPAMLPVLTQTPPSVWGNRECKLAACPLEASAEPGPTIPSQQAMAYLLRKAARPGRTFHGKVARTASALSSASRTLLVEVQIDNRDGALLPGMFSEVTFALPRTRPATLIPADALVANAQGTRVAVVDEHGKLHFRNVEVSRDLGVQVEIAAGLDANQPVVMNPAESLGEGQDVQTVGTGSQQ